MAAPMLKWFGQNNFEEHEDYGRFESADLVGTSVIRLTSKTPAPIGSDALILPWINILLALLVH